MAKDTNKPVTKADLIEVVGAVKNDLRQDIKTLRTDLIDIIDKVDLKWEKQFRGSDKKFDEFRDNLFTILDSHTVMLKRLDQERLFTLEWIKRIESDIELIKKHVGLVA